MIFWLKQSDDKCVNSGLLNDDILVKTKRYLGGLLNDDILINYLCQWWFIEWWYFD